MNTELLRFNGVMRRDPAIDAWLWEQQGDLGELARRWFAQMRRCGDEVREVFDWWATYEAARTGAPVTSLKLTDGRSSKIRALLEGGCVVARLKRAIDGVFASDFHVDGSHTSIDLICRNAESIDKYAGMSLEAPVRKGLQPNGDAETEPRRDEKPDPGRQKLEGPERILAEQSRRVQAEHMADEQHGRERDDPGHDGVDQQPASPAQHLRAI